MKAADEKTRKDEKKRKKAAKKSIDTASNL